jgi:hypothetical protein
VITGKSDLKDTASMKVQICNSNKECVPMQYLGTYFSNDFYGYVFSASGKAARNNRFYAVRLSAVPSLRILNVEWKNYSK